MIDNITGTTFTEKVKQKHSKNPDYHDRGNPPEIPTLFKNHIQGN